MIVAVAAGRFVKGVRGLVYVRACVLRGFVGTRTALCSAVGRRHCGHIYQPGARVLKHVRQRQKGEQAIFSLSLMQRN